MKAFQKLAAASALLSLMSIPFAASAEITRAESADYYYYDDLGQLVGMFEVPCVGRVHSWGDKTDNVEVSIDACPFHPIPPDEPLPNPKY